MDNQPADLRGWATKFNVLCADGRTIRPGSFDDCDGKQVPLVWEHMRDDPKNVLGHGVLHTKPEGVWFEGWFNDGDMAKEAKRLIQNRDVNSFSIFANKLKHRGKDVVHGIIREVSLVLAGANPEALIEFPALEHGDGSVVDDAATIYSDGEIFYEETPEPVPQLSHSAEQQQPAGVFSYPGASAIAAQATQRPATQITQPTWTYEPTYTQASTYLDNRSMNYAVDPNAVLAHTATMDAPPAVEKETITITKQEDSNMADAERTVRDVFNEMNDEQKNVVYFILGEMLNEFGSEDNSMKHNAFEETAVNNGPVLGREDFLEMVKLGKKEGSLREGIRTYLDNHADELSHSVYNADGTEQTYGIADIETLFPEYQNITDTPEWIKRDTAWAGAVMNSVRRVPFKRIKTEFANLTADEARAKGYVKGNQKVEQVFTLLKRTTDPQTVYKKQKLDKDDIDDITDFNVVSWIKGEMRVMLEEELARAILIGDGRPSIDDDKISPEHIRPIWGDDELFAIRANVTAGADDAATAKALIRKAIKARKEYKGSGNLTFFTTEDWLTEMLLLEDGIGHPLYTDVAALARKLRVSKIVTVPVMENQAHDSEQLAGIIVDLKDYAVGADKGGKVDLFDDFDIDFNQYKYLIETRMSGALTKPFSAIVLTVNGTDYTYEEVDDLTGVTNPTTEGYYEKFGSIYRPTKDTTVVQGKTYYEKTEVD